MRRYCPTEVLGADARRSAEIDRALVLATEFVDRPPEVPGVYDFDWNENPKLEIGGTLAAAFPSRSSSEVPE